MLPALAALEQQGTAMRGYFSSIAGAGAVAGDASGAPVEEWCERRLLARIHRYTLKRLRSEIEPATLADYQRFLFHWQGLGKERRQGREALSAVLGELQGLALPAAVWEAQDVAGAARGLLARRCSISSAAPANSSEWRPRPSGAAAPGRASTVATSPIAIVPRAASPLWRALAVAPATGACPAPPSACCRRCTRRARCSSSSSCSWWFAARASRGSLGQLVARGLVTSDSFHGLRARSRRRAGARGFAAGARPAAPPSIRPDVGR